jgi:hypothetical protein
LVLVGVELGHHQKELGQIVFARGHAAGGRPQVVLADFVQACEMPQGTQARHPRTMHLGHVFIPPNGSPPDGQAEVGRFCRALEWVFLVGAWIRGAFAHDVETLFSVSFQSERIGQGGELGGGKPHNVGFEHGGIWADFCPICNRKHAKNPNVAFSPTVFQDYLTRWKRAVSL